MTTKFCVEDDTVSNLVVGEEYSLQPDKDLAIEIATCPYCNGIFGVDVTYLDQVDDVVHCPMCCMEIIFDGWE